MLNNNGLNHVKEDNFLGLVINNNLNWNTHVNTIVNNIPLSL